MQLKAQLLSRPLLVLIPALLNAAGTAYAIKEGVPMWLSVLGTILPVMALGSIFRDLSRRVTTFRVYSHPLKGEPTAFWRTIRYKLWLYTLISRGFTLGSIYQVRHGIPIK